MTKENEAMFEENKDLAKKEETAVATTNRAIGTESIHADDVQLPRWRLIQATSKEAEDGLPRTRTYQRRMIYFQKCLTEFQVEWLILLKLP